MARKDALLRLHNRLMEKRDDLRAKITGGKKLGNATPSGGDVGDVASDGEAVEIDSQLAAIESRELAAIERAIRLIKEGRYGKCDHCGSNIPIERLRALPFSLYCVSCQTELEESGNGSGGLDVNWDAAFEFEGKMSDRELTLRDIDVE